VKQVSPNKKQSSPNSKANKAIKIRPLPQVRQMDSAPTNSSTSQVLALNHSTC